MKLVFFLPFLAFVLQVKEYCFLSCTTHGKAKGKKIYGFKFVPVRTIKRFFLCLILRFIEN